MIIQKALFGLSEMLVNAVEHGNLGINIRGENSIK